MGKTLSDKIEPKRREGRNKGYYNKCGTENRKKKEEKKKLSFWARPWECGGVWDLSPLLPTLLFRDPPGTNACRFTITGDHS